MLEKIDLFFNVHYVPIFTSPQFADAHSAIITFVSSRVMVSMMWYLGFHQSFHEQELICLEKHEKKLKKEKEKNKEKEVDKKSISLKASSSKSSTKKKSDNEYSNDEYCEDEEIGLFVRRYNKYIQKKGLSHSEINLINYNLVPVVAVKQQAKDWKYYFRDLSCP